MSSSWAFSPKDVIAQYERLVKTNKPIVDLFDQLGRFFILLFLEREDREWETELAYSSLNLLNYYHGTILKPAALSDAENQWIQNQIRREALSSSLPAQTVQDEYNDEDEDDQAEPEGGVGDLGNPTLYWNDPFEPDCRHYRLVNETLNRTMSKWLQLLSYVEVIVEMTAERFDKTPQKRHKWSIVLAIESLKCICKLRLLIHTGGRIHIDHQKLRSSYQGFDARSPELRKRQRLMRKHFQTLHLFSEDTKAKITPSQSSSSPSSSSSSASSASSSSSAAPSSDHRIGRRSGRAIPDPSYVFQFIGVHKPSNRYRADLHIIIGEILYAIRPVIYVLCLMKWQKRWSPWLVSLFIDILSRALVGNLSMRTKAEKDEITRRTHLWLNYLFRSPFFDQFLKPFALVICNKLSRIPILNTLLVNVLEYMIALQSYYFYTASS